MNTTEHKQGQDKLRESEKKYRQLFDTLQEGIWAIDKDADTTFVNPRMVEMLGYTVKEMQGKHLFSFMDEHGVALAKQLLEKRQQGIMEQHEFEFIRKDGKKIYALSETSPLLDENGNYTGALAGVLDITERKKAEEQLKNLEELYKNLIELAPDSIVTMDLKGYITSCNSAATRILGYSKDDLVGKHFSKIGFLHVKDIPKYLKVFVSILRGKGTDVYELTVNDKDGASRIVEAHIGLIKENNKISGILAITRDITERKKAQEEIKRLAKFPSENPNPVLRIKKDGAVVYSNKAGLQILDFWKTNIGDEVPERWRNIIRKKFVSNNLKTEEEEEVNNKIFKFVVSPVIDEEYVNLYGRDVTKRKRAEEKIKSQYEQLKKLDGVKTDFLNTTSHELRTPVASIKGYIQMLLKQTLGEITEEQKKALEVMLRNTNRLDHLIQDILDISRLESGMMKFITEKTDATKMIKEIAEIMQVFADLKRIKINSDIQKGILYLMIDQERIKQVLMNLVDNAIKFSPDGSTINIKIRKEKEDVLFEVQDFGRGIPKNKQKKIFKRFYQVDSGIDRKFGGIGLGLAISKKIIDTFGGKIWVDSTVGKGSSFKFSLPLKSTKNIEDDLQEIYMERP